MEGKFSVEELINSVFNPAPSKLMPLAAIWMDKPIHFEDGTRSIQVAPRMRVRVTNGLIDTDSRKPTHIVNECWGTLTSSELYFDLIEIETDQPIRLRIK